MAVLLLLFILFTTRRCQVQSGPKSIVRAHLVRSLTLKKNSKYYCRVAAKNKVGVGPYSETSKPYATLGKKKHGRLSIVLLFTGMSLFYTCIFHSKLIDFDLYCFARWPQICIRES